ncbi:uncharacterized protein LOC105441572 isoform X4 [Strongylocentrotus purpuratus]|uniref:Uncharacterized protein n=1 Tax=Strongylocentrotus purpuratus TaxID=7668 RepID=A0A7M7HI97_STRPU|nr:uncharacterized protein LOC105441572 isoform X4 [Strongylocentrotus purpuratus]|eukprot:XP_011671102.1 PREDICTED: uncharacterized protein LOC105441572 isoform X4 [Strongylocentrotus purpuratus]
MLNSQPPPLNRTVSEESLPNHVSGTYPRQRKQSQPTPRSEFILTSTQSGAMPSQMQAEKTMLHVPGMEQSAFKSISIDHLDDADDAIVGAITFANNAAVDKRMSKSSDSLSGGLTQRRSRSTSLGEKDADSAYEEGPAATAARSKSELEVELRRLTHQLNMERKQKEDMQSKISKLQEERMRLQDESTSAAVQLRQIKDWIYQGDKPVK